MCGIDRGEKNIGIHQPLHSISSKAPVTSESEIRTPLGILTNPLPGRATTREVEELLFDWKTIRTASEIS